MNLSKMFKNPICLEDGVEVVAYVEKSSIYADMKVHIYCVINDVPVKINDNRYIISLESKSDLNDILKKDKMVYGQFVEGIKRCMKKFLCEDYNTRELNEKELLDLANSYVDEDRVDLFLKMVYDNSEMVPILFGKYMLDDYSNCIKSYSMQENQSIMYVLENICSGTREYLGCIQNEDSGAAVCLKKLLKNIYMEIEGLRIIDLAKSKYIIYRQGTLMNLIGVLGNVHPMDSSIWKEYEPLIKCKGVNMKKIFESIKGYIDSVGIPLDWGLCKEPSFEDETPD